MTPPQFMLESQAFFASCNEGNCSIVSGRYTFSFSSENSQRVGVTAALLAVATVALSLLPRRFVVVAAAAADMTTASKTNTAAMLLLVPPLLMPLLLFFMVEEMVFSILDILHMVAKWECEYT